MEVALYYKDNGYGLSQDAKVITKILRRRGMRVNHSSPDRPINAHTSIHFEIPSEGGISRSNKSIFFPNFEWFFFNPGLLKRFHFIACKTEQAIALARNYTDTDSVVYTGFTSEDIAAVVPNRKHEFFHIGGRSNLKNTQAVYTAWKQNPDLPMLHLYTSVYEKPNDVPDNINYNFGRVERQVIQDVINGNLFAVQPSATEGFGHILWESLAAYCILITSDAPPMNLVPTPFLVQVKELGNHNLQKVYAANPDSIASVARTLLKMQPSELYKIALDSRKRWADNRTDFINRFMELL